MLKQCPKCKCVSLNCIEEEKKNNNSKMTRSLLFGGRDVCNSSISQRRTDPVSWQNVTDTLLAAEPCKLSTGCARITADNRERLIISLAAAATGRSIIRTANKARGRGGECFSLSASPAHRWSRWTCPGRSPTPSPPASWWLTPRSWSRRRTPA